MSMIGIIGAGEMCSQLARAAVRHGHRVVLANSRGPHTLGAVIEELGPRARAATAADAADAGDFVIISVPLKLDNDMPVEQLAGKVVLDTNNHMPWRDGVFASVVSGQQTVHELRQQQLPTSRVAKAFTHPGCSSSRGRRGRQGAMRSRCPATIRMPSSWSPACTTSSASTRSTTAR